MTPHRLLRAAMFASLTTALACTATVGNDDVDEFGEDALNGVCTANTLDVVRDEGLKEFRFLDSSKRGGTALNPGIPAQRICDSINEAKNTECFKICLTAKSELEATGVRGAKFEVANLAAMGRVADAFNAALGNDTNFEANGAIGGNAGANNNNNNGNNNGGQAGCKIRQSLEVIATGTLARAEMRYGVQGRQVALNPAIPLNNICQNQVDGGEACKQVCRDAALKVKTRGESTAFRLKLLQAMGAEADAFNRTFGITTNFAQNPNVAGVSDLNNNNNNNNGGNNNNGVCTSKLGDVQVVLKGRENRFGLQGQQVALDPGIPMNRVCNSFGDVGDNACKQRCVEARERALSTGVRGFTSDTPDPAKVQSMGVLADQFNAALGRRTNFAANPIRL